MPLELDEEIQEEADRLGISYSKLVRQILRSHTGTPFDPPESDVLADDRAAEEAQMGGA
jgi:hypothetical protein